MGSGTPGPALRLEAERIRTGSAMGIRSTTYVIDMAHNPAPDSAGMSGSHANHSLDLAGSTRHAILTSAEGAAFLMTSQRYQPAGQVPQAPKR